jgi:hypothetical protein
MRTAVGISSGRTDARSGEGATGAALPAPAGAAPEPAIAGAAEPAAEPGPVPVFAAAEPVVAGVFFWSALSFGPAATLAAKSKEENTTTVEVARMRNLQPALAGDLARTSRRTRIGAFSCGMLQL